MPELLDLLVLGIGIGFGSGLGRRGAFALLDLLVFSVRDRVRAI